MNGNKQQNEPVEYATINKFDRIRGGMADIALFTKPSTIKTCKG